jgi:hypothetical protein
VHNVERHNLFVLLAHGVEHPQSVEPPPQNMQRCYVHVEDDHESGARVVARKSPITADQSKKRAGSSRANESPEDSTRKHHHMVRDWSEDKAEEDVSAYKLNPQKKRSEQTIQGGSTPPAKRAQEGQTPPVGPTPSMRTVEEKTRPPPQDGG